MSHFFYEKETVICGRKEKQEYKIGENLSLRRRRRETISARRKSLPDLKDNSPGRLYRYVLVRTHMIPISYFLSGKNPQSTLSGSKKPVGFQN